MNGGLIVDTSAAVAILTLEPAAAALRAALASASARHMSTATYLELAIVLEARYGPAATGMSQRFVRDARIELAAVDTAVAERALEGWRRFGKGRHPAALNYGDCFSYGLSVELDEPILCTGEDFARTDATVVQNLRDLAGRASEAAEAFEHESD